MKLLNDTDDFVSQRVLKTRSRRSRPARKARRPNERRCQMKRRFHRKSWPSAGEEVGAAELHKLRVSIDDSYKRLNLSYDAEASRTAFQIRFRRDRDETHNRLVSKYNAMFSDKLRQFHDRIQELYALYHERADALIKYGLECRLPELSCQVSDMITREENLFSWEIDEMDEHYHDDWTMAYHSLLCRHKLQNYPREQLNELT